LIVFVGTLPPEDIPGRRDLALLVPVLNQEIARIAATRGATLVDFFSGMNLTMIGADGLHPNVVGYQRMADLVFAAVTSRLDVPFSPTLSAPATGTDSSQTGSGSMLSAPRRRPLPPQLRWSRD
jgi:hypothetical protein